jgi:hypothetical protein
MNPSRGIFTTWLFILLRFSPVAVPYLVLDLSASSPSEQALFLDRTLRLVAVLTIWSLTEGVAMLYIKKRNAAAADARGYGAVTILGALLVLGFLQVFRIQVAQNHFIVLLTALALRGMSRSGWEQGRPHISLLTSIGAHSLLAALSLLLALGTLPWPTFIVAAAVGSLLGAVEAAWYGGIFRGAQQRWIEPTHRVSLAFAPLAITALALLHALPPLYALCFVLTPLSAGIAKRSSISSLVAGTELYTIAGTYLVFMAIMTVCRIYS